MAPEVVGAYVTAAGGLLVALFNVATTRSVKRLAEAAKQTEQIRLHATTAGEALLASIAELIIQAEGLEFLLSRRTQKVLTQEEAIEIFRPMGPVIRDIRKDLYASALYVSSPIRKRVTALLEPLHRGEYDFAHWGQFVGELRERHAEIAAQFRETYLGRALSTGTDVAD